MPDSTDHLGNESNLARAFLEASLATAIECGDISVGDRQVDEILADFRHWVRVLATSDDPAYEVIPIAIDHRPSLLKQAQQHTDADEDAAALILYATWIEHSINALISRGLERQRVSESSTRALLRAVNLDPKITALWEVAGIPAMDTDLVQSIRRIAGTRNEVLHYKWHSEPDDPHAESSSDRYKAAIRLSEEVVSRITSLSESFLCDGRHTEIVSAFRLGWAPKPSSASGAVDASSR